MKLTARCGFKSRSLHQKVKGLLLRSRDLKNRVKQRSITRSHENEQVAARKDGYSCSKKENAV